VREYVLGIASSFMTRRWTGCGHRHTGCCHPNRDHHDFCEHSSGTSLATDERRKELVVDVTAMLSAAFLLTARSAGTVQEAARVRVIGSFRFL